MRKTRRTSMEELIATNKKELMSDPQAISKIEERLENRKAKEVYLERVNRPKKVANK